MSAGTDLAGRYRDGIIERLEAIVATQAESVRRAAQLMAAQIQHDRLIHVYGVGGHSYVGSEEFFWRAGGLANINPMFEASLALAGGGQKSTLLERVEGIGDKIVRAYALGPDDLLIITSAYGLNACTIDAALEARRRGCRIIGISSFEFARQTPRDFPARHSSGQNLFEIADVAIDNHVPHGEAFVDVPGFDQKVGGTCTVLTCFCVNWLVIETVQLCRQMGLTPPVWRSANVVGGDEANRRLLDQYVPRVKAL